MEVVEYLVANGLSLEVSDKSGMNLLHEACLHGSMASFQYLLTSKLLDVNAKAMIAGNHHGNTPLLFAISNSALTNSVMATALIEQGADVHVRNSLGRTPLHEAVQIATTTKLSPKQKKQMMLDRSINQWISQQKQDVFKLVQLILDKGVDINSADNAGDTALHLSLWPPTSTQITRLLLEKDACVHVKGRRGETPLHRAVRLRCLQSIIELMLKKGSDPNARDDQGRTSLHLIVVYSYTQIVQVLVKHGADLQVQDEDGNTVLHHAALNPRGTRRLMEILVDAGVNPHILNKEGKSAFELRKVNI
ncbi:serine/threonine-protein phosphatase 6 regulatory ankyrin repeat subunit C-like [Haliotis rubra]|uniref:serine/threonine-protein phosphatase 6 regulatory ankyrin repeat subunit C-like n=1 Tax=Haliotis rubra TaxID=36100 RepID=UPI001EE5EEA5|nr:serine/threonine-protein phosphatase 6 regulatory ankyrin repeat subunit C-like [Haliotis rubra]